MASQLDELPGDAVDTSNVGIREYFEGRRAEVKRPVDITATTPVGDLDNHRVTLIGSAEPTVADGVVVGVGGGTREAVEKGVGSSGNEVRIFVNSTTGIQTGRIESTIAGIGITTTTTALLGGVSLRRVGLRRALRGRRWVILVLHGGILSGGGLLGRSGIGGWCLGLRLAPPRALGVSALLIGLVPLCERAGDVGRDVVASNSDVVVRGVVETATVVGIVRVV